MKVHPKSQQETYISDNCKIGRGKNNNLCLSEESVSREHAMIVVEKESNSIIPTKYYLKDIGSKFGTYVPI